MKDFVLIVCTPRGHYTTKKVEKVFANTNITINLIRRGYYDIYDPMNDATLVIGKYETLDDLKKVIDNAEALGYDLFFTDVRDEDGDIDISFKEERMKADEFKVIENVKLEKEFLDFAEEVYSWDIGCLFYGD